MVRGGGGVPDIGGIGDGPDDDAERDMGAGGGGIDEDRAGLSFLSGTGGLRPDWRAILPSLGIDGLLVRVGEAAADIMEGGPPIALTDLFGPLGGGGVALAPTVALPGSFLLTHFLRSGS